MGSDNRQIENVESTVLLRIDDLLKEPVASENQFSSLTLESVGDKLQELQERASAQDDTPSLEEVAVHESISRALETYSQILFQLEAVPEEAWKHLSLDEWRRSRSEGTPEESASTPISESPLPSVPARAPSSSPDAQVLFDAGDALQGTEGWDSQLKLRLSGLCHLWGIELELREVLLPALGIRWPNRSSDLALFIDQAAGRVRIPAYLKSWFQTFIDKHASVLWDSTFPWTSVSNALKTFLANETLSEIAFAPIEAATALFLWGRGMRLIDAEIQCALAVPMEEEEWAELILRLTWLHRARQAVMQPHQPLRSDLDEHIAANITRVRELIQKVGK